MRLACLVPVRAANSSLLSNSDPETAETSVDELEDDVILEEIAIQQARGRWANSRIGSDARKGQP